MLGSMPVYTLTVNQDSPMLPYKCISHLPPVLIIPTAPTTVEIHIKLTKITDSKVITFPVVNSLLGAFGVRREFK